MTPPMLFGSRSLSNVTMTSVLVTFTETTSGPLPRSRCALAETPSMRKGSELSARWTMSVSSIATFSCLFLPNTMRTTTRAVFVDDGSTSATRM